MSDAAERIDEFAALHPHALRLATAACLAVRVEPHFLRALRQHLTSAAPPGLELDLWHGPLVSSAGADAFAFRPDVQQELRERLTAEHREYRLTVLELTLKCHPHHPPLARLEVELNASAVIDPDVGDNTLAQRLLQVLERQRAGGEGALEIARWLLQAAPRLHPRLLKVGATWDMLLRASAELGGRRLLDGAPPSNISAETIGGFGPMRAVATRPIGIALANGWLSFRSPLLAGAKLEVPAITPSMVVVIDAARREWAIEATPGKRLEVSGAAVTVRTLAGDEFRVEASRQLRAGVGALRARATRLRMRIALRSGGRVTFEVAERDAQNRVADQSTHVRAEVALPAVLAELVASASNDPTHDAQIRATLHHLLIPREIEYLLAGSSETWLELDSAAAAIPWELLDIARVEAGSATRPWAIRAKLLRLSTLEGSRRMLANLSWPAPASPNHALVIGEPRCDDPVLYPPLPGARAEARAVVAQLGAAPLQIARGQVHALASGHDDARAVINALFERHYRIVHLCGHGRSDANGAAGVVLSGNTMLGAAEIQAMAVLPELVFVNCGHVVQHAQPRATSARTSRVAFAAAFAEQLLAIGVRCVVMVGWTVEAEPAQQFAGTFYEALFSGERFADASAAAREAAWRANPQGNSWGAYQCCGDPEWRWSRTGFDDSSELETAEAMASPLALAQLLDELTERARANPADQPRLSQQMLALEQRYGVLWGQMGAAAQAFGAAFGQVDDDDRAVRWYSAAVDADDSSVTFRAVEQLAHHLTLRAGQRIDSDATAARSDVDRAVDQLSKLCAFQRTAEREYRLGAALKTSAMLMARHNRGSASKLLLDAYKHFEAANELAGSLRPAWAFDAGRQQLVVELWMVFIDKRSRAADSESQQTLRRVMGDMAETPHVTPLERIEMRWMEAMTRGTLQAAVPEIMARLQVAGNDAMSTAHGRRVLAEARLTLNWYETALGGTEGEAAQRLSMALPGATAPGSETR